MKPKPAFLGPWQAAASIFDAEVRALVSQHCSGYVTLQVVAEIAWGHPLRPGK